MKILIFTEGTILRHSSQAKTRAELVSESKADLDIILDYAKYVPIGNAKEKIEGWHQQGAEIFYLTSRRIDSEIQAIRNILKTFDFPQIDNLLFRKGEETYADVAERLVPDIIIEDNCESIGGITEMTYTNISPELKATIKSIPVEEFGGIDFLPTKLSELQEYV